jgi:hypothetical protein
MIIISITDDFTTKSGGIWDFLLEAYRQTQKSSAPGMDQVTAKQDAEHLAENLRDLHERLRDHR